VSRATRTTLVPNIARSLLNGPARGGRVAEYTAEHVVRLERIKRFQTDGHTLLDRPHPERSLREKVHNGTADGVVAACDCRRRHRVGERRRQPVAKETAARGGRRIRPPREAREEDKGLDAVNFQQSAHCLHRREVGASTVYAEILFSPRAGVPQDQSPEASEGYGCGRFGVRDPLRVPRAWSRPFTPAAERSRSRWASRLAFAFLLRSRSNPHASAKR
jgi:hypothetical protein